jgi:hypothetical protein
VPEHRRIEEEIPLGAMAPGDLASWGLSGNE